MASKFAVASQPALILGKAVSTAYNASLLDRRVDSGHSAAAQRKQVYLVKQA